MAYTKTTWVNDSAPPLSAENLNKIEDGIYQISLKADAHDALLTDAFYITTYTPSGYSFSSGQTRNLTRAFTPKTGYTPVVLAAMCTNSTAIDVTNFYIEGSDIKYDAVNRSTSSVSASFRIVVLFIKTALIGS